MKRSAIARQLLDFVELRAEPHAAGDLGTGFSGFGFQFF